MSKFSCWTRSRSDSLKNERIIKEFNKRSNYIYKIFKIIETYNDIGTSYREIGDYKKALLHYMTALQTINNSLKELKHYENLVFNNIENTLNLIEKPLK